MILLALDVLIELSNGHFQLVSVCKLFDSVGSQMSEEEQMSLSRFYYECN